MARRLADRVAVVTGGGGNIGSAICLRLAEEGSAVAVVDINGETAAATARRLAQLGANSVPVTADLRSRGAVVNALNAVMTTLGPVDVLVNSLGIDHQIDPVDITDEEWDLVIDTNLRAPFLCCQELVRQWLLDHRIGSIVNVASVESVMPFPRQVHYAASKGGVLMLTRALARDVAEAGIRVNAVGPGTVPKAGHDDPSGRYLSQYPLGRLGTGQDVAAMVAFLASDEASWITGQTMYVDGGWLVR
jgi:NAD(P)-dependent dehydrogenase (short-subunit alcohol dehydrogenase family)